MSDPPEDLFDGATKLLGRFLVGADAETRANDGAATVESVDAALDDLRRQVTRAGLAGYLGLDAIDGVSSLPWVAGGLLLLGVLAGLALLGAAAVGGGFATRTLFAPGAAPATPPTPLEHALMKYFGVAVWVLLLGVLVLGARKAWTWGRALARLVPRGEPVA